LCSFTLTDTRHRRSLECGAITLRALCAPVSVPSVVNLFPRSRPSPISAKTFVQTLHLAQDEYINAVPPRHPEGTGVEFGKPRE